jgi:uncharacterized protein YlxP (DUF503 family)
MIVGVAVVELRVHESQSLKEKRGVVRKIVGRLRHRFNVSVAEVGGQDTWQRAVVGLTMAGSDETVVRNGLARALEFVEETHLAEVLASEIELMRLPLEAAAFEPEVNLDDADEDLDLPWSREPVDQRGSRKG